MPSAGQNNFLWDTNCDFNSEVYDYCGSLEFCSPSQGDFGYRQLPGGTCSSPGPSIRLNDGKRYLLTLVNNVENTVTNLHTHGLHVSGDGNADDVTRRVEFNNQLHYVWDLRKGNQGGTYWYHAHHHGETYNQVNKGALGMLIVNDDFDSLLPAGLANAERIKSFLSNEQSVFVHYKALNSIFGSWYANGKSGTQLEIIDGEWTRFRIAASHAKASRLGVRIGATSNSNNNPCVTHIIAHDGVYLNDVPSEEISETTITSASRVDLAVRCLSPGAQAHLIVANQVVATITVVAGSPIDAVPFEQGAMPGTWTTWSPNRPEFVSDLLNEPVPASNKFGITLSSDTVNGVVWNADIPLRTVDYDQVQEWTIYDSGPHPFHMHLYHMQIVSPGGCGDHDYGEWYDTVSAPGPCTVRFKTVDIGQRMVMHCHIIEHSDSKLTDPRLACFVHYEYTSNHDCLCHSFPVGSMGWVNVIGGPTQSDQNPGIAQEPIGTTMQQRSRSLRGKDTAKHLEALRKMV